MGAGSTFASYDLFKRSSHRSLSRSMLLGRPLGVLSATHRLRSRPLRHRHKGATGFFRQPDVSGLHERPGEASPNPVYGRLRRAGASLTVLCGTDRLPDGLLSLAMATLGPLA